ncbi:MAG: GNAT family N-acetyltransferase [Coriobacteriales bacterium]|jgi:GNAT superfamily N-acetyltransferase
MGFEIREATRDDIPLFMGMLRRMAAYEKLEDWMTAEPASMERLIFDERVLEVFFAVEDGIEVGFSAYSKNFSTFYGFPTLFLEDIFIEEEHRRKGYGRKLVKHGARLAVERGYGRMDWYCLDWNKAGIDFYESLGAKPLGEWVLYRLEGEALEEAASK